MPLPWPKPALQHPDLQPASAHVMSSSVTSRLFAAEPFDDALHVEVYERQGAAARGYRWQLDHAGQIEPAVAAICGAAVGELGTADVMGLPVAVDDAAATFLVCTQGSHDTCCGTSGVALANDIENRGSGYVVRRVSHTGGHRFSPTFMAFPEGRMWAFADLDLVDRIATNAATEQDHREHARGWWGATVGPAQVAECAVRSELAGEPFAAPVIEAVPSDEGKPRRFDVSVGDTSWQIDVSVGRTVPTISCESPGGLPVKPGREFSWVSTRR